MFFNEYVNSLLRGSICTYSVIILYPISNIGYKRLSMSKFFLESPKPKLLWQDHRVLSFKEFQKSLKKFKLFQIQKIIKKIKATK